MQQQSVLGLCAGNNGHVLNRRKQTCLGFNADGQMDVSVGSLNSIMLIICGSSTGC